MSLPEDNVVVEVADGTDTGGGALRGEARFDERTGVEHTEQGVDQDLRWTEERTHGVHKSVCVC